MSSGSRLKKRSLCCLVKLEGKKKGEREKPATNENRVDYARHLKRILRKRREEIEIGMTNLKKKGRNSVELWVGGKNLNCFPNFWKRK